MGPCQLVLCEDVVLMMTDDSLVHEQTPDEVLELPHGSDTSDLEDKGTIVVQEVVNLLEERAVLSDTNVL